MCFTIGGINHTKVKVARHNELSAFSSQQSAAEQEDSIENQRPITKAPFDCTQGRRKRNGKKDKGRSPNATPFIL